MNRTVARILDGAREIDRRNEGYPARPRSGWSFTVQRDAKGWVQAVTGTSSAGDRLLATVERPTLLQERAEIEKRMRADRQAYEQDEALQARYRAVLSELDALQRRRDADVTNGIPLPISRSVITINNRPVAAVEFERDEKGRTTGATMTVVNDKPSTVDRILGPRLSIAHGR